MLRSLALGALPRSCSDRPQRARQIKAEPFGRSLGKRRALSGACTSHTTFLMLDRLATGRLGFIWQNEIRPTIFYWLDSSINTNSMHLCSPGPDPKNSPVIFVSLPTATVRSHRMEAASQRFVPKAQTARLGPIGAICDINALTRIELLPASPKFEFCPGLVDHTRQQAFLQAH